MRYGFEASHLAEEWALLAQDDDIPQMIDDALASPDADKWRVAAEDEMKSHQDLGTWKLVKNNPNLKPVGCRWIFTKKKNETGAVVRFKARLVAKGYAQRPGVDYDQVYAPVIRYESVRLLIALAARKKLLIHQMDVETAFLHGQLQEAVYMEQPPGFHDGTGRICLLRHALYGLKQSPRCWNKTLHQSLLSSGLTQAEADPCVYVSTSRTTVVGVYVDDLLLLAASEEEMNGMKKMLADTFRMKDLGVVHHLLGFRVGVMNDYIKLDHSSHIELMLKRFGMEKAYDAATPADSSVVLTADDGYSKKVDRQLY